MLKYYIFEQSTEGYIYSCDKICIIGNLEYFEVDSFSNSLSWFLVTHDGVVPDVPWQPCCLKEYKHYEKYGVGEYRNNFNFFLSNGSSFYFAYRHNSNKVGVVSWKFELNPNKCLPCDFFFDLLRFVLSRSKVKSVHISQFDLAIDFPLPRNAFYLEKDRRISTIVNDGYNNTTEYLSKHNSHGFVKLYNKQNESDLLEPLTRFEITLKKLDYDSLLSVFPCLHVYDNSQLHISEVLSGLSHNDDIFLELLRLHPEYFKKLTYRKQQLFKPYILSECPCYQPSRVCFDNLMLRIKECFNVE